MWLWLVVGTALHCLHIYSQKPDLQLLPYVYGKRDDTQATA